MEKTVLIVEQLPLQERSYNDRNGQPQVFASRGFVLTDGIDTFYAEMTGDKARSCQELDKNSLHRVQCQLQERSYKDKDGAVHHTTEVKIVNIA